VEELIADSGHRRAGIGRMVEFERHSAARGCKLIALATRRTAAFYRVAGYREPTTYFRRVLSAG
jgi:hypothetical protein